MERAGAAVAREALAAFPRARRFAVVCGSGSNGGDGRVAARLIREAGREAEETNEPEGADVVVDALFGTGLPRRASARGGGADRADQRCGRAVVAVDLPSGVDASTGEVAGVAVRADLTVTFHGRKVGLVVAPGRFHAGRVVVADIGLEPLRHERSARHTPSSSRSFRGAAPTDTKYTRRLGARRRRLARA